MLHSLTGVDAIVSPRTGVRALPLGPVAEVGLVLLTVGVPTALGGVHRATIAAAALVSCLTLVLLWLYRRQTHRGLRLPWFGAVLLGLTGYTALQMVPLPVGLLRLVAPGTVELLKVSLAGSGGLGSFHAISLDPGATLWETLKIGTCALAFIVAHNHFGRRERRDRLLLSLVIAGVVLTLLGFVGAVAAPGQPLMLYSPEQAVTASGLITTSFVNPNHGAAFLALCSVVAVGLTLSARDLQPRVLLGLGSTLLGAGVFVTLSRGGMLALALGLLALAALLVAGRGETTRGSSHRAALVPAAVALILGLSAWLAYDAIVKELRSITPELESGLGKIALWGDGLRMALDNAWVGVGRGAFLTSFPHYVGDAMSRATFSHLENQYLHLPIEWGLPVAAFVIASTVTIFLRWLRGGRRDPESAAMAAGLLALAGHALFDFNLETLGVALPAAVLAGLLSGGVRERSGGASRERGSQRASGDREQSNTDEHDLEEQAEGGASSVRHRRSHRRRSPWRGRVHSSVVLGVAGCLAALTVGALATNPPDAAQDLEHLGELMQHHAPTEQVLAAVREAVRRHPADPMPQLAAARQLVGSRRLEALIWLNRATYLFPRSPDIHLETARALRLFGHRGQALLEYRLALSHGAPVRPTLLAALPLARTADGVARALPDDPKIQAAAVEVLLGSGAKPGRVEVAAQIAARARARWPRSVELGLAEVRVRLVSGDIPRAVEAARTLAASDPEMRTFLLWAQAARQAGLPAEFKVLEQARERFPEEAVFGHVLADAYLRGKRIKEALVLAELLQQQASTTAALIQTHLLLARIHRADGRVHRAQYEMEQVRKLRGQ